MKTTVDLEDFKIKEWCFVLMYITYANKRDLKENKIRNSVHLTG